MCIEANEQEVADFFLVELGGNEWGALQRVSLIVEHTKCILVVLMMHCRLWLERSPRTDGWRSRGRTLLRLIGAAYVSASFLRRTGKPISAWRLRVAKS